MKKTLLALVAAAGLCPQGASAGTAESMVAQIAPLAAQPLESYRYDRTRRCTSGPQAGALALEGWLGANVGGGSWGIFKCRRTRLGPGLSLHAEGRAVDWHLDVERPADRAAAYGLIKALLARDGAGNPRALARRMGIQEIIYDCRIWTARDGDGGMRPYSGCRRGVSRTIQHKDHLHIGLNWRGALARTSFWRSPPQVTAAP